MNIEYLHLPELAPTAELLESYRKKREPWEVYERRFLDLMAERRIDERLSPDVLDGGSLLCSEAAPHRCHRRLVAEYLRSRWSEGVTIRHLG